MSYRHSSPLRAHPAPSGRHSAAAVLVLSAAFGAASCSSDDDSTDTPPVPNTSTSFASTLTRGQTTNNATLGAAVRVTVRNGAPAFGTFQTPVWLGIHDGTFDIYDSGVAASAALESLAEDGDNALLTTAFDTAAVGAEQVSLLGTFHTADGPIPPNEPVSHVFRVDPSDTDARYLSYASMVIPSNDAFVANGDPMAHELFDMNGDFVGTGFTVLGTDVLDAGTEDNDEVPANTAFFGQAAPNTGDTTVGGVVGAHPGFLAAGMGGILDNAMFAGADFATIVGYTALDVTVEDATGDLAEPTGFATAAVNSAGTMLQVELAVSGLSGPATLLHLHEGDSGVAGPVAIDLMSIIDINEGGVTTASGAVAVTEAQIALLRAGDIYFNLHTALNPAGEVRGQIRANDASTGALTAAANVTPPVTGETVTISVLNSAPTLGTHQTPIWLGFHDGTFDIYDLGSASSMELERIAEDGNATPLTDALEANVGGSFATTVAGAAGPIAPGELVSTSFRLNPATATNSHFSWASMILPSNDAFIANADPVAHEIFNGGTFSGADFMIDASTARDAGTEDNDEIPANTAFFGQMAPDTGVATVGGVVAMHPGFLAAGMGGILDDAMFTGADFANVAGYEFLRFSVTSSTPAVAAAGVASIQVNGATGTINANASNLSGAATAVLLRNAAAGADGATLVDLTGNVDVNADGEMSIIHAFTADAAFRDALSLGEVYLEIQTALNPTGELRAQLTPPAEIL